VGQRLVLDVSLDLDRCDAATTDELEDTVDYGAVSRDVAEAAQERSYRTLERLCAAVAVRVLDRYAADSVTVRASKPEPPLPMAVEEVAVQLTRPRG
jgi:dihydroneopterin aldolase